VPDPIPSAESPDRPETTAPPEPSPSDSPASLKLALAAAVTAAENRGRDIVVLDLRRQTPIFDYFVIVTGTSRRQLHALSEEIDHKLEGELHDHRMGIEGYQESKWILLDYGSVVIHLFDETTRDYFDLEALWARAPRVDLTGILPKTS
jgi:ribosome-associated protein